MTEPTASGTATEYATSHAPTTAPASMYALAAPRLGNPGLLPPAREESATSASIDLVTCSSFLPTKCLSKFALNQPATSDQVVTECCRRKSTKCHRLRGCRRVEKAGFLPVALSPPMPDSRDLPFALLAEREQVAVDELGMRGGEAVRQARIVDFHGPLDQLC